MGLLTHTVQSRGDWLTLSVAADVTSKGTCTCLFLDWHRCDTVSLVLYQDVHDSITCQGGAIRLSYWQQQVPSTFFNIRFPFGPLLKAGHDVISHSLRLGLLCPQLPFLRRGVESRCQFHTVVY